MARLFAEPRIAQIRDTPYLVDDLGRVWKYRQHWAGCFLQLKLETNNRGYKIVRVWKDNRRRAYVVHVLVARYFLPRPDNLPGQQVRHLNGNKPDNRAVNLAWGTQADNEADKKRVIKERSQRSRRLTHVPSQELEPAGADD